MNHILVSLLSIFIWTTSLAIAGVLDKHDLVEAFQYWRTVQQYGFEYADVERIRNRENRNR